MTKRKTKREKKKSSWESLVLTISMETIPQRPIWKQFSTDHWSNGEPISPSLTGLNLQMRTVDRLFFFEKSNKIGSQIKIKFTPI